MTLIIWVHTMQFTSAVEASKIWDKYKEKVAKNHNRDLAKYLTNIEAMIKDLSKLEVVARRTRQMYKVDSKITEIKGAFNYLDKMLIMQQLMK